MELQHGTLSWVDEEPGPGLLRQAGEQVEEEANPKTRNWCSKDSGREKLGPCYRQNKPEQ